MIDYVCPSGHALFRAEYDLPCRIEIECAECEMIVTPRPRVDRVWHRTYRCSLCGRTQFCENPKNDRSYCVVCGRPSLTIISETRPARVNAEARSSPTPSA